MKSGLLSRYNASRGSSFISANASSKGVIYFDSFSSCVPGVKPSARSSTGANVYINGLPITAAQATASVVLPVPAFALTIVSWLSKILSTYIRCSSVSFGSNPYNRFPSGNGMINASYPLNISFNNNMPNMTRLKITPMIAGNNTSHQLQLMNPNSLAATNSSDNNPKNPTFILASSLDSTF